MANRISLTLPFGPDDRPGALSVIVVLGLFTYGGYALTHATLDDVRPPSSEADQAAPSGDADTREAPAEAAPVAAAHDAPAPTLAVEDGSVPRTEEATPAVAAEGPADATPGTLTRGRIAYIRCDGAESSNAASPCPRDPAVERAVWTAIEQLPTCPALAGQRGSSDVRVVFTGGTVAGLGFRDIEAPILDRDAVRGCLEPALANVRSTRPSVRMTASFLFDIR